MSNSSQKQTYSYENVVIPHKWMPVKDVRFYLYVFETEKLYIRAWEQDFIRVSLDTGSVNYKLMKVKDCIKIEADKLNLKSSKLVVRDSSQLKPEMLTLLYLKNISKDDYLIVKNDSDYIRFEHNPEEFNLALVHLILAGEVPPYSER